MIAVNYSSFRENMKKYMDKTSDEYETVIVTRKNNKNVVILSEETYNNMLENIYIMSNKENYSLLLKGKENVENNKIKENSLLED